jgi:hypothetical protein
MSTQGPLRLVAPAAFAMMTANGYDPVLMHDMRQLELKPRSMCTIFDTYQCLRSTVFLVLDLGVPSAVYVVASSGWGRGSAW